MAGNNIKVNGQLDLKLNLQTETAKAELANLQQQLQAVSNIGLKAGKQNQMGTVGQQIKEASSAAMQLQSHLKAATNVNTGNLDFSKFAQSLGRDGKQLAAFQQSLIALGPQGKNAFLGLANSIAKSEIPLKRTNKLLDTAWGNLKKTAGWQLSSSVIHGIIGGMQQAVGYAKDLDRSLNDIRIVTGASSDQMAKFAQQANKAAKSLSSTTTDYTKASLIYYQQGLSDAEVKARTETTIKMANVTGTTAQKVSDQMTAIWNNYDNGTKSLEYYADAMAALGSKTASSTDEIAQGLQKFASISQTVGLSYEYAAAALATVTSTSRESADVVGNAFKTLFARIQGLQLGETLEDGTTLNKYSQALNKVGISIKDSSGEMKDMDVILDEMGQKWTTLGRAEQTALAQTVAGVRQYTQLMTLMNNWDEFKSNVTIAKTSTGTLDSQMAIYEESWKAASNRLRTAWEGLWDSLINSDSFTTILDGMASFVGMLEKMVDGIGGAGGVLTTFGGILTRVFNTQITNNVAGLVNGIRQLSPAARKQDYETRKEWLANSKGWKLTESGFAGKAEARVIERNLDKYAKESFTREGYRQFMSEQQLDYDDRLQNAIDEAREMQRQGAADVGAANRILADTYGGHKIGERSIDHILKDTYMTPEQKAAQGQYEKFIGRLEKAGFTGDPASLKRDDFERILKKGETGTTGAMAHAAWSEFSQARTAAMGIPKGSYKSALNQAINRGLAFKEGFTKDFWDNTTQTKNGVINPDYGTIKQKIKEGAKAHSLSVTDDEIDAQIKAIQDSKDKPQNKANRLREYVDKLSRQEYDTAVDKSAMTDEEKAFFKDKEYKDAMYKKQEGIRGIAAGHKLEKDKTEERDKNDKQVSTQKKIQGAVSVGQGLMSTAAAVSSLEGLGSALKAVSEGSGDATSVLTALGSTAMNTMMGFSSLSSVMGGPWAAALMAAIAAATLLAKHIDKTNVSEKERIKTLKQSDAEIQNATENVTNLSQSYKDQNQAYKDSVEHAQTNATASAEMVDDIFQANKQAMELIQQYGLTSEQYTKNTAGLIEINEQVLEDKEKEMEDSSEDFQRTQALSNLTTKRELAESELKNYLESDQMYGYSEQTKGAGDAAQSYNRYYFGDAEGNKWTLEKAIQAYGTEEWDQAKQFASDYGYGYEEKFKKLEEQILAYQEANNLLDLAAKNNVDALLRGQEYTLDGYETFAKLGYDDYLSAYNQQYENGSFSGSNQSSLLTEANKKRIEEYLKAQGYTGVENIKFDGSDIAKFTFDHDDGTGDVNVEAIRKWDAEQFGANAAESTFGRSMELLQALYQTQGEDAAPGLMSLLTGDNFENATINEMNKAKEAAATIAADMYEEWDSKGDARKGTDEDIAASISKHFGKDMTAAELKDLLNLDPTTNLIDWFNNFKHVQSSAQRLIASETSLQDWATENAEIANNINQNTLTSLYSNFKQASLLGGEQAGKDMLAGITEVLSNSGLSEDEYDQALQGLLSIDWSNTLSSGGAAAAVIENLGGTLDTTTAAWQAFAAAMESVSGAMPDFSEVIAQLTDLAAAVQGLSGGDLIDPEIVEQLINLNPEFADMFSKHHSGKYTFIGDDNSELKNAIWDEMNNKKSEASDIEGKYDEYVEGRGKGLESNNTIDADDFGYRDVGGDRVYDQTHAMNLANIAGYSNAQVRDILEGYETSNINLSAWGKDQGRDVNGTQVRLNANGKYETMDANGKWVEVTDQAKIADYTAAHSQDQTVFNTTKAAHDTLMNSIHGLDEVSGEWTQEEIEAAVSTADSAADVFDKIRKGQAGFTDEEDGTLSEGVLKGLQALPETSERATTAIDNLVEAEANYAENKTEANRLIYEEALRNAELQTSIDAVAAARDVDADLLAQQVAMLEASGQAAHYSAEDTAKLAAEIVEQNEAIDDLEDNYDNLSKSLRSTTKGSNDWMTAMSKLKKILGGILSIDDWNDIPDAFVEAADAAGILQKAANGDVDAIEELRTEQIKLDKAMESGLITAEDIAGLNWNQIGEKVNSAFEGTSLEQWAADFNSVMDTVNSFDVGELITGDAAFNGKLSGILSEMGAFSGSMSDLFDACAELGITPELVGPFTSMSEATAAGFEGSQFLVGDPAGTHEFTNNVEAVENHAAGGGSFYGVRFRKGGGGGSGGGGGGGGGGGEPKKVANKRKSQTVKRYKKNDARRSSAQSAKKSASTQKDYLYGESKIAQMEKINKLAAKEAAITSDRIKESRKYMIEDRENLIKYMQKYGYEADFDSDGFLNTYEEAWGKIHDKIAKLYEDNELTKDEQKLEEDYKVELEELDGALEDYENSLKELQSDIEAYEESLYEMYDNKVEQMQHKVEFRIELNEDDLSYLDFWIEALGDSLYNALESLQTMGAKTNVLFDGINTYKQGIEDIYALSDDPFQAWATGGLDDVLTADQVDALRENRDGLMDYMQQLLDLRQTMQDKVLDVFDKWQEKLSNTMSTIEHYGSVIEHFRNIMDVVGKDALGLDDQFMARFEQSAIDQSMDNIDATKAHYESLVSQNEEAQRRLAEARARGDKASEEHWQGVVDSTTEAMQSAQDSLLSSLESTLDMIASQFESAMTRAVEAFNDAIYEHGGLSGLSEDYSFMREQSDLMAQDYDKIYQLSKLNRNINKTLSDTNIIAGKQKMKSLQQEINELQASGVELSKYDLDYLQAKYELRLAEIELENAKNAKDTVRLSKDSEGNWSYIYTSSTDKVDEAQQKYEDALYAMQNLSYEYMEEMSNGMMQTSLAMMEKIQSLRIQDFDSYEAYAAEVKRIQDQYAGSLQNQQNELDKSMMNNQELYNQDWQAYSDMTGYKISAAQDWADNFSETTLGALMGSESSTSDFADTVFGLSNTLSNDLGTAAMSYFANVETAMNKYGTSINGFGSTVTTTVGNISTKSKTAANDMKTMAQEMNDAFTDITESVANWQKEFSGQIDSMLKEIGTLVQSINEAIQKSAEMTGTKQVGDLIGSAEAAELLSGHEEYDFGDWKMDGSQLKVKGVGEDDYSATTFVEENAKLIDEINKKLLKYTEAKTGSEDRARLGEELEALFKKYHAFKDIVSRVYDPTTLAALKLDNPNYASMDTGGYTGEWGDSGKFAMLHEKELVLNQDDTKNFLDALSISREVLHSMIEMNAKQSSLALGDLYPSSIQDMSQMLEQQVSITAEFPNATNRSDIEDAFNSLINTASQYANRYK